MDALYQLPFYPYLRPGLMALIAIGIVYYLVRHFSIERASTSRLKRAAGVTPGREDAVVGSTAYQTRLALEQYHLPILVNEGVTRILGTVVLGTALFLVLGVLGTPLMVSAAAYVVAWFLIDTQISGAWSNFVLGIEKEIPTFLTRLSSVLQIEPNVMLAVNEVMETLEEEKPLRAWLARFLARLQTQGSAALEESQAEAQAISPSLGLAVYEIGKMMETAGPGYRNAFKIAAENVRSTLQARAAGAAKAAGAKNSNKFMVAIVLFAMIFLMRMPSLSMYFDDPANQLLMAGILGWMFFGWSFINAFIRSRI